MVKEMEGEVWLEGYNEGERDGGDRVRGRDREGYGGGVDVEREVYSEGEMMGN